MTEKIADYLADLIGYLDGSGIILTDVDQMQETLAECNFDDLITLINS